MAFLSKLPGLIKVAAPVVALILWAGPGAADGPKDAVGSRWWPPVELYKSTSPSLPMPQTSGQERATTSVVRPVASPANDNFADAIVLQGQSGTVSGTNVDATSEPGEPEHAGVGGISSVWYTVRASRNVVVRLDTFDSDFDTVLAVYTGSRVDNLTEVASNDDAGGTLQSQVAFLAEAGTTYRIAVDGFQGAQGNFTLNFERADVAPNDSFDAAIALERRSGSVAGNNFGATAEPGEPDHTEVASPGSGQGVVSSVWYTLRANRSGVVTLNSLDADFDTVLAVYTGNRVDDLTEVVSNDDVIPGNVLQSSVAFLAQTGTTYRIAVDGFQGAQGNFALTFEHTGQPASPNDDFGDAIALQGGQRGSITGNNVGATVEPGEPAHNEFGGVGSVWYTFMPDRRGVTTLNLFRPGFVATLAVYEGDSVNALDEVASGFTSLAFFAEEGATYRIAVDTDSRAPIENVFDLVFVQTGLPQQANDDFEDAIALEGRRGSVTGNTLTATAQPDEPAHANVGAFRSLWYTFTPNRTGIAIFDTFGSSRANEISPIFDTLLAVYTGDDLASLTEVVSNDDAPNRGQRDRQSEVIFLAERGVTYRVAVDGFNGSTGRLVLNYRQTIGRTPPNDDFANARVLRGESAVVSGFNVGGTAEPGEPSHANVSGPTSSVWWRWRAPFSGDVTFTTAGSTFDTVLAVYQGDTVSELTPVQSNDDAQLPDESTILESLVTFRAEEGEIYHLAVDGFPGSIEEGSISLAFTPGEVALKPPTVSKRAP